jgi:hypothetical protein
MQLTGPDECSRHVMLIPMIITRRTSGSRYFCSYIYPTLATRSGAVPRIGIHSPRRWQHARGLCLELASIRPALATRSGVVPRISIHSPQRWQHARGLCLESAFFRSDIGNTHGGCASHWYSSALALATRSGAASSNLMLATHSGAAPYAVNFSSLLNHRRCFICYVDFGLTYSSSTSKTLCRVDSGPLRRLCSAAFDNIIATATSTSSLTIIKD